MKFLRIKLNTSNLMEYIKVKSLESLKDFIKDIGGIAFPLSIITSESDEIELVFLSSNEEFVGVPLPTPFNIEDYDKIEIDSYYLMKLRNIHRPFISKNGGRQLFYYDDITDKLFLINRLLDND